MLIALNNLVLLSFAMLIIWAVYVIAPIILNLLIWTLKGAWSIIKSLRIGVVNAPFVSLMFVLFAISWPYLALAGFIIFAMLLGDLGENDRKLGV